MTSGAYTICGANVDSWDHALLHCVASMCVWALLDEDLTEVIASLNLLDPKQWLFLYIIQNMQPTDSTKTISTCWAIWGARRKINHEGVSQSPLATVGVVNRLFANLEVCNLT